MNTLRCVLVTLIGFLLMVVGDVYAQSVDVGGRAYVDYFYDIDTPAGSEDGLHGFRYRRLYLTTDFTISEDFSGRARLEADGGTDGVPFVKDLSLTWAYSGEHQATIGVTPPPAFALSEDFWGYRSLEQTIMDVQDVVDSRDFGLRFDGPLTGDGAVRYAVMLANNNAVGAETNKNKRLYGQLSVRPSDRLLFVAGGDYADYSDARDAATRLSVFGGYKTDPFRVGLEAYWSQVAMTGGSNRTDMGASLFGVVRVAPEWEVVGRIDRSRETVVGPDQYGTLFVGGIAYQPHPNISLIPNLRVRDQSPVGDQTTGRFTVEVQF